MKFFHVAIAFIISSPVAIGELQVCLANSDCDDLPVIVDGEEERVEGICVDKVCRPCKNGSSRKRLGESSFCYFPQRDPDSNSTCDNGMNFTTAVQKCERLDMQLVEMRDRAKYDTLTISNGRFSTWLGLSCDAGDDSCQTNLTRWAWESDGMPYNGMGMKINETDGTIVGGSAGENCAHWWQKGNVPDEVSVRTCQNRQPGALCEVPPPAKTNQDIVFLDGTGTSIGLTDSDVTIDLSHLANDDKNELQDLHFNENTKELSLTQSSETVDLSPYIGRAVSTLQATIDLHDSDLVQNEETLVGGWQSINPGTPKGMSIVANAEVSGFLTVRVVKNCASLYDIEEFSVETEIKLLDGERAAMIKFEATVNEGDIFCFCVIAQIESDSGVQGAGAHSANLLLLLEQ